jgi:hypothetical protein
VAAAFADARRLQRVSVLANVGVILLFAPFSTFLSIAFARRLHNRVVVLRDASRLFGGGNLDAQVKDAAMTSWRSLPKATTRWRDPSVRWSQKWS